MHCNGRKGLLTGPGTQLVLQRNCGLEDGECRGKASVPGLGTEGLGLGPAAQPVLVACKCSDAVWGDRPFPSSESRLRLSPRCEHTITGFSEGRARPRLPGPLLSFGWTWWLT